MRTHKINKTKQKNTNIKTKTKNKKTKKTISKQKISNRTILKQITLKHTTSKQISSKDTNNCNYYNEKLMNEKHYNSEYMKNSLCRFVPLYDFDVNNKKNVVSACFFKMESGGYKDFSRYVNGIKLLDKLIKDKLIGFNLRLFIDLSVYEDNNLMELLKKIENIEIVVYCCELFAKHDKYHLGTFGTILRIFPMFDFPNNDTNVVIMSDIDIKPEETKDVFFHYQQLIDNYSMKQLSNIYLYGKGRSIKSDDMVRNFILEDKYIRPYITFPKFIGFRKIPGYVLENFFKHVAKTKKIYSTYTISDEDRIKKCEKYICFGIDEYFSNNILLPFLLKKKLPILFLVSHNIQGIFYNYTKYNKIYNKKIPYYINKIVEGIDPKYFKGNSLYSKIKFFNNLFYTEDSKNEECIINKKDMTDVHIKYIKNYFNLFYDLYKRRDFEIFHKDFLTISLLKENIGYFRKVVFLPYYTNNLNSKVLNEESLKINMPIELINKYNSVIDKKKYNNLKYE